MNRVRLLVLVAALSLAVAGSPRAAGGEITTKQVVDAATKYVASYEHALALILGDERTLQVANVAAGASQFVYAQRLTTGEFFLTFLPTDGVWIAVHDVNEVDGAPVTDRDSLIDLMQRASIASVARDVANRNARFNVGHITRNFNEPTLALLLLDEKRVGRVHFSKPSLSHDAAGGTLATIEFEEKEPPTLVQSTKSGPVFSKGKMTIDPLTGRIEQTEISFKTQDIRATLTTTYTNNEKLELWLPAEFTESYHDDRANERIDCKSTYSNYKRFETVGAMKIK